MQVFDSLYNTIHDNAAEHYHAFYSSELQGITVDPGLMLVHMDDHLVHRGHAVFDTAVIVDGFLYQLPEHLLRFQHSAEAAGLVSPHSIEQIQRIICETAAASQQINGEPLGQQSLPYVTLPAFNWCLQLIAQDYMLKRSLVDLSRSCTVSNHMHCCNMLCYLQRM